MTTVLPLPFAALAMIAQRKPNLDKGFEEIPGDCPESVMKLPFLLFLESKRPPNQGFT
jgi:hypothetical protein